MEGHILNLWWSPSNNVNIVHLPHYWTQWVKEQKSPYFHMESLSVGYLVKFFSSSTSARWIPSLVETLVQHKSSWRASLISLDESFKKKKGSNNSSHCGLAITEGYTKVIVRVQGKVSQFSERRQAGSWEDRGNKNCDLMNSFICSFICLYIQHLLSTQ